MKQHILVTGGAGFIGTHLVDALISRNYQVTILDKKTKSERCFVHPKAGIIEADITKPQTMSLVKKLAPDVIIHLAANANVAKSVADPIADADLNYLATVRMLEVAKDMNVRAFIYASTGGALSSEETLLPTPEHLPANPLSPYAKHKLASEFMGEFYRKNFGLPFLALRFSNVYGPRQSATLGEANVIATFIRRMVNGEAASINGSGNQTRDYIYISDTIDAIILALETAHADTPINIGSGIETSVNEIHTAINAYMPISLAPVHKPAAKGEPMRSCLDITKAKRTLNWSPKISLAEGLQKTIAWQYQQNKVTTPLKKSTRTIA